jgi:hypothetical protein
MRLLLPLAAGFSGLALLFLLGFAQLIWASSEASYWVQLVLAVVVLAVLAWSSGKVSRRTLALAVAGVSFVTASMPVENRLILMGLPSSAGDQDWRVLDVLDALTPPLIALLIHLLLVASFAFAVRASVSARAARRSRSAGAGPAPAPRGASDI